MLLIIDNYDSFTYNLVQYFGELGAEMEIYRNDEITVNEISQRNPERICISPGPCSPDEAGISCAVIEEFAARLPILGVCLGHQCIGQVSEEALFAPHVSCMEKPLPFFMMEKMSS